MQLGMDPRCAIRPAASFVDGADRLLTDLLARLGKEEQRHHGDLDMAALLLRDISLVVLTGPGPIAPFAKRFSRVGNASGSSRRSRP